MVRFDGDSVLPQPDRGQDRLREAPAQGARRIHLEHRLEDPDPGLGQLVERGRAGKVEDIAQRGADFVFHFSHHPLGVDGQPSSPLVTEHVAMVQVAVQEPGGRLRSGEFAEGPTGVFDQATRDGAISTGQIALEAAAERVDRGWVLHRAGRHRLDDPREDRGRLLIPALKRQRRDGRARLQAFHEHGSPDRLQGPDHASSLERLQDFARPPFIPRSLDDLQDHGPTIAGAVHQDRVRRFHGGVREDVPRTHLLRGTIAHRFHEGGHAPRWPVGAFSRHFEASTPLTRSHAISTSSARKPIGSTNADRDLASGGQSEVSQPIPATIISMPVNRGRNVDSTMSQPIRMSYSAKQTNETLKTWAWSRSDRRAVAWSWAGVKAASAGWSPSRTRGDERRTTPNICTAHPVRLKNAATRDRRRFAGSNR